MNRAEPKSVAARSKRASGLPRGDVQALLALVALDESVAKGEASVAQTLALAERASSELARLESELRGTRDELRRRERSAAEKGEIEKLQRSLRDGERHVTQQMQLAERKQEDAVAASAELRDACADLAARRGAIASRMPREALEDYESALRRGLLPAAVATRGKVCWGCFHPLAAALAAQFRNDEVFLRCPHCERVLFNPDWIEQP